MNPRVMAMLKRHEGFRQFPYRDSVGILTIGYGRNLEANGIGQLEAEYLLEHDIQAAHEGCLARIPVYSHLDSVRQAVLLNMAFNMGVGGLVKWTNTLEAINQGDYDAAADMMLQSKWAEQVGRRALELVTMMRNGQWLDGAAAEPAERETPSPEPIPQSSWWRKLWD